MKYRKLRIAVTVMSLTRLREGERSSQTSALADATTVAMTALLAAS
jgi:hypothetical protein